MNTTVDGEYQKLAVESGAYIREHFFGPDPRLRKLVEDLSDDELVSLPRGGHDYRKLYAAYKLATEQRGAPTVILAKTIKGWTLGPEIEARNATHQIKKMTKAQLRALRDRLYLTDDIPDSALEGDPPYIRPAEGSDAMEYLRARGRVLDGPVPGAGRPPHRRRCGPTPRSSRSSRRARARSRSRPPWCSPACCATSCATPPWARSSPRSSRTRPAPSGSSRSSPRPRSTRPTGSTTSRSTPTCRCTTPRAPRGRSSRRASPRPARWPSFTALATAYATWGQPMVPVFLFYSMFGFQRVGDLAWALGDMRGRGILAGCTAGRTTLHGRGAPARRRAVAAARLDQPGRPRLRRLLRLRGGRHHGGRRHRHARARTPRTASGTSRSTTRPTRCPPCPRATRATAVRRGIIDGHLPLRPGARADAAATCGRRCASPARCGASPMEAQRILAERYGVAADAWAVTSWTSLRTDALEAERWNRLHPEAEPRTALVTAALGVGHRSRRRHHRLHAQRARPGGALRATAPTSRSGPTGSAAPTPGRPALATSRSTPPTSSSPCCSSWLSAAVSIPRWWPGPSPTSASTRRRPAPFTT